MHPVVERWRVLDDGRRPGNRRGVADIQLGAIVRLPRVQQRHPVVGVDARPKVGYWWRMEKREVERRRSVS